MSPMIDGCMTVRFCRKRAHGRGATHNRTAIVLPVLRMTRRSAAAITTNDTLRSCVCNVVFARLRRPPIPLPDRAKTRQFVTEPRHTGRVKHVALGVAAQRLLCLASARGGGPVNLVLIGVTTPSPSERSDSVVRPADNSRTITFITNQRRALCDSYL